MAETRRLPMGHQRATDLLNQSEYGHLESQEFLYKQVPQPVSHIPEEKYSPLRVLLATYVHYFVMIVVGHVRDFFARRFNKEFQQCMLEQDGYAPLLTDFDSFYTRRLKQRLNDCFSRPTTGVPGRLISVFDRWFENDDMMCNLSLTGETIDCVNLSSYNYLGFAQSAGQCTDAAEKAIKEVGLVAGGTRVSGGTLEMHLETEKIVADFVGKEAAMLYSMGYATNTNVFATVLDKKCLVLSDELNHASIRTGLRLSGAVVKVFKHNDMDELESLIREQISQGQSRSHRPWRKIMVVVEGLYSMEGTMCDLPRLVELRDKYGIYLFMDEAHSIGAMGPHGRGMCDYFNISPSKIDVLMGTFTKSFGAAGGYVAGCKELVDRLRVSNMGNVYAEAVAPPVLAQIQASLRTLTGEINPGEAAERLQRLAFNTRYFRLGLIKMGFVVGGDLDSPVVPLMLYTPPKMSFSSRMMLERKIAIVIVGYPATPLLLSRIRFCLSSALTKSDLDYVLKNMEEIGDFLWLRNSRQTDKNGHLYRKNFDEIKDSLVALALDPTTSVIHP